MLEPKTFVKPLPTAPPPPSADQLLASARGCLAAGDFCQATDVCRRLLTRDQGNVDAWIVLGNAHQAQRQPAEAAAAYRRALALVPTQADALLSLGIVLAEQGAHAEVVQHWREAVRRCPTLPQAHHNLGVALALAGAAEESLGPFQRALELQSDYAEAHYNLANTLRTLERFAEAITHYQEAVRLRPDHDGACNNLGLTLGEVGRKAEAIIVLRQAVRLRPTLVEAHNNLGMALAELGRFAEAEACYHEALRLNPTYYEAHVNLGSLYKEQGRFAEAQASYQFAIWLRPDNPSAHWNRALAWLQEGDYARGWPEYEWRWRRPSSRPRGGPQPRWDGSPLAGRRILLWTEQGLGDALQFIRYAPLVQRRGGTVIVEAPALLVPLLSACPGIERVVAEGSPVGAVDVQAPLLSLPALLRTTQETVPADVPYLAADEPRQTRWRQWLEGFPGFKVGIVWQGNPHYPWDHHRSVPLAQFAPLAAVPGVRLISLQKVFGLEQLPKAGLPITELQREWDRPGEDFLDTAAVMTGLDLVVSVDTATAHLAGALARPVWLALGAVSDWRWIRHRDDSPWYPTMRLYRQRSPGDWSQVFTDMATDLGRLVHQRTKGVQIAVSPGELLDRLTILRIKSQRITDPTKLRHIRAELAAILETQATDVPLTEELDRLMSDLQAVNERLWEVEDAIRACEQAYDHGPRFVELARAVYQCNDRRSALKRRVNELLGAAVMEQKSYA